MIYIVRPYDNHNDNDNCNYYTKLYNNGNQLCAGAICFDALSKYISYGITKFDSSIIYMALSRPLVSLVN